MSGSSSCGRLPTTKIVILRMLSTVPPTASTAVGQVAEGLLGLREVVLADQLPIGREPDLAADEDDPRPACDRDVTVGGPFEKPIGIDQLDCH